MFSFYALLRISLAVVDFSFQNIKMQNDSLTENETENSVFTMLKGWEYYLYSAEIWLQGEFILS